MKTESKMDILLHDWENASYIGDMGYQAGFLRQCAQQLRQAIEADMQQSMVDADLQWIGNIVRAYAQASDSPHEALAAMQRLKLRVLGNQHLGATMLNSKDDLDLLQSIIKGWPDSLAKYQAGVAIERLMGNFKLLSTPMDDWQIEQATGAKRGTPIFLVAKGFAEAIEQHHGIK